MPHKFTEATRATRVTSANDGAEPHVADFLANLLNGDESWVQTTTRVSAFGSRAKNSRPPNTDQTLCEECSRLLHLRPSRDAALGLLTATKRLPPMDSGSTLAAVIREKKRRCAEAHLLHDDAHSHVAQTTRRSEKR